nr:unnamed protein product [Callosobruchus analis]
MLGATAKSTTVYRTTVNARSATAPPSACATLLCAAPASSLTPSIWARSWASAPRIWSRTSATPLTSNCPRARHAVAVEAVAEVVVVLHHAVHRPVVHAAARALHADRAVLVAPACRPAVPRLACRWSPRLLARLQSSPVPHRACRSAEWCPLPPLSRAPSLAPRHWRAHPHWRGPVLSTAMLPLSLLKCLLSIFCLCLFTKKYFLYWFPLKTAPYCMV